MKVDQAADCNIVRAADRPQVDKLPLRGRFQVEHIRDGKVIGKHDFPNGITNEGKNFLLDAMFHAEAALSVWYIGLIDNSGFSSLDAADIYDNIDQAGNNWDEFKLYTDDANGDSTTTRPTWTEGAASGQSITNASPIIFDITGTGTVKGVFVVGGTNAQTKGDHTAGSAHKLWATALFTGGDVAVLNGDQLKVTYSVAA
jgi:hypothetical protein